MATAVTTLTPEQTLRAVRSLQKALNCLPRLATYTMTDTGFRVINQYNDRLNEQAEVINRLHDAMVALVVLTLPEVS